MFCLFDDSFIRRKRGEATRGKATIYIVAFGERWGDAGRGRRGSITAPIFNRRQFGLSPSGQHDNRKKLALFSADRQNCHDEKESSHHPEKRIQKDREKIDCEAEKSAQISREQMTKFISIEEVIELHDDILASAGGLAGFRDRGLLESAVFRMQAGSGDVEFYPDIFSKAAALFHSLAGNHAFNDGNKRTAWMATNTFLNANGFEIAASDEIIEKFVLDAVVKRFDADRIEKWLQKNSENI